MAKTIEFEFEGKEWTLAFTRRTIEQMERAGIVLADIARKPMSMIPKVFEYSFLANHKGTKRSEITRMYDLFANKDLLMDTLAEMIEEPMNTLFEEPDAKNAIQWTVKS